MLWKAANHTLQYLSETKNLRLVYGGTKVNQFKVSAMPSGAASVQPESPLLKQCLLLQVSQFPGAPNSSL